METKALNLESRTLEHGGGWGRNPRVGKIVRVLRRGEGTFFRVKS